MRGNLKAELARRGMTTAEIGSIIGVSANTVISWGTGRTAPNSTHLIALSKLLDVSPDYLLVDTSKKFSSHKHAKRVNRGHKKPSAGTEGSKD